MSLADRHCKSGAALLPNDQVAALRQQLPDWKVEQGKQLSKTYQFPDFRSALDFVNRVGEVAESEGHHPDLHLTWGRVDVSTWTHSAGGLTESDFILAAKIERAYSKP
jgi:4a-hydroxytetrahydrobiopterin dehydratase